MYVYTYLFIYLDFNLKRFIMLIEKISNIN